MSEMSETVYSLFQKTARRLERETAVITTQGRITFGELLRLTDTYAASFPPGVKTVGVVMDHGARMIAAILATLKIGARYVPAEPDFPIGRIRYMMREAGADIILTQREYTDRLEGFAVRDMGGEAVPNESARPEATNPKLPAYVLYTSGTTGRPKGVCVTQANILHYIRAFAHEFHPGPGDVMLQYSVCTFDIFVEEVFASLLNGAAIAVPNAEEKADIHRLMAFVARCRVTIISGFPYLFAQMNRLETVPGCLRLLISGGDVLRGSYVDRLIARAEVYNSYGPSETTVCALYYRCRSGAVLADGTYPVGKAVQGAAVRILDEDGRELPTGETGEICIYGNGVSLGYIGHHEEENRAFEPQPGGGMMYRSGDLGYRLDDGNIAFLRRKDDQIMIYGKRVEISEVESRLYRCQNVAGALVRAFTDENGLSYMIAYIVAENRECRLSDIRRELSEYLPAYMIPEFFVRLDRIPVNANGKPDTEKLPVVMK